MTTHRSQGPTPRRDGRQAPARPSRKSQSSAPSGHWLIGIHAVLAALANPARRVHRILATRESAQNHADALARLAASRPLPAVETVPRDEIDALAPPGAVHQGLAAQVTPLPPTVLEEIVDRGRERERAVVMVLDQVTDPHNVGAILRSAAAFGALAVVVPDRHAPEETATLAKAASGALERLPLVRVTNIVRALEQLKTAGFWTVGLDADGPRTLAGAGLSGRLVLVMGAEGEGLRRLTREHCDHLVRLPMTGAMESLNVSNAAAIALYEITRAHLA